MSLSVVIITKNEEETIFDCLSSIKNLQAEIIIVDDESTDRTREIAKSFKANVFVRKKDDFAGQRNYGLSLSKGDWLLSLDADERLTEPLVREIKKVIASDNYYSVFFLYRQNFYLGTKWPYIEKIPRLFKKNSFQGWFGRLHESPKYQGEARTLENCFLHYTHRDLSSMLYKTISWSEIEAKLRFENNHPQVSWWRFLRVMFTAFINYFFLQKGYKVGTKGIIESTFQAFSIFITYARLYEMQIKNQNCKNR